MEFDRTKQKEGQTIGSKEKRRTQAAPTFMPGTLFERRKRSSIWVTTSFNTGRFQKEVTSCERAITLVIWWGKTRQREKKEPQHFGAKSYITHANPKIWGNRAFMEKEEQNLNSGCSNDKKFAVYKIKIKGYEEAGNKATTYCESLERDTTHSISHTTHKRPPMKGIFKKRWETGNYCY